MITFKELRFRLSEAVQRLEHQVILQEFLELDEDSTFYIYRTDTNAVLARGIHGFEAAKARANQIRKTHNLKWDQVKFKSERGQQGAGAPPSTSSGSSGKKIRFGVSGDGRTFTNAYGQRYPVEYSRNFNPSRRGRFRGYTDAQGNFHDID
jgi:hypothetical protein